MGCSCKSKGPQAALSRGFYVYAHVLYRHPLPFLLVPIVVSLAAIPSITQIERISDIYFLYAPSTARAWDEREMFTNTYPMDPEVNFTALSAVDAGDFGQVIFTPPPDDSIQNIWHTSALQEIVLVDKMVKDIQVNHDGALYSWKDMCTRDNGECTDNVIISLLAHNGTVPQEHSLKFPHHYVKMPPPLSEVKVPLRGIVGGVEVNNSAYITTVKALMLNYHLLQKELSLLKLWQTKFVDTLLNAELKHVHVSVMTSKTFSMELEEQAMRSVPNFTITVSILIIFSIISCLSLDCVIAKPWLACAGLLSALLAVVTAFGILFYCGLPFIDMLAISPFLALGIGLDDMFVMIAGWRQTSPILSPAERLAHTFSESAVSITITSLTDVLAIAIGTVTSYPAVRLFCIFTALCIAFDYLYQITFFGACMVYAGKREADNKSAFTCQVLRDEDKCSCCAYNNRTHSTNKKNDVWAMRFFRDYFADALSKTPVKVIALLAYLLYLAMSAWGCLTLKQGLRYENIVSYDSYAVDYFQQRTDYYSDVYSFASVSISGEIPLWERKSTEKLLSFIEDLESVDYIQDASHSICWIRDLVLFGEQNSRDIFTNKENFTFHLKAFLAEPAFEHFARDLVTKDDNVMNSRIHIFMQDTPESADKMGLMTQLRKVVDNSDYDAIITSPYFLHYDAWKGGLPNTAMTVGIATLSVIVVTIILIPQPVCVIAVSYSLCSITFGLVGIFAWWDVYLDSISMIIVVISIGFSVDFSAHITYSYVTAPYITRKDKLRHALYVTGYPITQGSTSTILAVVVLADSFGYIFTTFFKTIFLTMTFGAIHGLVLIPIILVTFGPMGSVTPSEQGVNGTHKPDGPLSQTNSSESKPSDNSMDEGTFTVDIATGARNHDIRRSRAQSDANIHVSVNGVNGSIPSKSYHKQSRHSLPNERKTIHNYTPKTFYHASNNRL